MGAGFEEVELLDVVELVDVSGDGWGCSALHLLRRGGRTSQNRLSDNTVPLFFGRPARAGRTLTVMGVASNGRSNVGSGPVDVSGWVGVLLQGNSQVLQPEKVLPPL